MNSLSQKDIDRFWGKVKKTSDPNECWLWTAGKHNYGYGMVWWGHSKRLSHIVSYEIAHGKIPEGLFVCHKCDNPPCVNPNHLFLGTHQDNMDDMVQKGRHHNGVSIGEKHGMCKLTDAQVAEIRNRYVKRGKRENSISLAKEFGVHSSQILRIVNNTQRT